MPRSFAWPGTIHLLTVSDKSLVPPYHYFFLSFRLFLFRFLSRKEVLALNRLLGCVRGKSRAQTTSGAERVRENEGKAPSYSEWQTEGSAEIAD